VLCARCRCLAAYLEEKANLVLEKHVLLGLILGVLKQWLFIDSMESCVQH
jgi:hypothetical protein